jgi:hypothetical protein
MITYDFYAELQVKYGDDYLTMPEYLAALQRDMPSAEAATTYQATVNKIGHNYSICKTVDDANGTTTGASATEHYFTATDFKVPFENETLAPNVSSTDKFRVTIAESDLTKTDPDFYVHVWAVPSGNTLHTIESRLYGASGSDNASSWHGTMRETNLDEVDYDFYNYIITGNGAGYVDILWDPAFFDVNEFFFSALSGNTFTSSPVVKETILSSDAAYGTDYAGWKKVTLQVNSLTGKSRYELQLYKVKANTPYTDTHKASKYIACFFRES